MNIRKRKQIILTKILLGVAFFLAGFFFVGVLGTELMHIPEKTLSGSSKKYYLVNYSFQPASLFVTIGCFILMLSNMVFFDVVETLRRCKYESYMPFRHSRLMLISIFALNLNFFTSNYFADITEYYLEGRRAGGYLEKYEIFNVYFSEFLFGLVVIMLIINTGKKKIAWFGSVTAILGITQSVLGIMSRTFTVKWLWYIYILAMAVCIIVVMFLSSFIRYGLGPVKEGDEIYHNIAFFVSPHGYGHLMRTLPVMAKLLENPDTTVLLVTGEEHTKAAKNYMKKYSGLAPEKLETSFFTETADTDFGIAVKSGSLEFDRDRVREGIEDFIARFPELINTGVALLEKYNVTEVVSDICPWSLVSASRCEIPSVLMASFTWIEIYEEYFPESLITTFRQCYHLADHVLLYELANRPTVARFANGTRVGYVCRPINEEKVKEIKEKYSEGRPIVFFTVGLSNDGLAGAKDVSSLPYTFITTAGVELEGPNVFALEGVNDHAQDYIAASDYCIIKSGWTTVSECMIAGVPMALIGRPDVAEDRMTIEMLTEGGFGVKIDPEELEDMGAVMEKLYATEWVSYPHTNDISHIAEEILKCV